MDWRHTQWDSFRDTLQQTLHHQFPVFPALTNASSLTAFADTLSSVLASTITAHVPLKHVGPTSHPWWTPELTTLRSAHLRARRRWKRSGADDDRRHANVCKRALRSAVIAAKRSSWKRFCEETSVADMWSSFRKVTHRRTSQCVQPLVSDGVQFFGADDQANLLADRFFPSSIGQKTDFHRLVTSEVAAHFSVPPPSPPPSFSPVTPVELH